MAVTMAPLNNNLENTTYVYIGYDISLQAEGIMVDEQATVSLPTVQNSMEALLLGRTVSNLTE